MQLNLPTLAHFKDCQRILIAGMGGGFDLFCGLPLMYALEQHGHTMHLANLTFMLPETLRNIDPQSEQLFAVSADSQLLFADLLPTLDATQHPEIAALAYTPEVYLAQWLYHHHGREQPIWCFPKAGVRPLLAAYRHLVAKLNIDGLILVDGGVDGLMRGDEPLPGTFVEDTISLAVAAQLDNLAVRQVVCIGLGAEQDLQHYHVFENIAAAGNAFLGSCALVQAMEAYQFYEAAVLHVHQQPHQQPSVINASIISAVRGAYGDYHLTSRTHGSRLWISPLMSLYWCFDLPGLAAQHHLLATIQDSYSFRDALDALLQARQRRSIRPTQQLPLA